jgi:Ca2+-transporting ATPase
VAEAAARLRSDLRSGLGEEEARRRLDLAGPNQIAAPAGKSRWAVFWGQLQDFMVLVLLGAAAVSFFLGEAADGTAILAIVAVNAVLGFLQEMRAERSLEALRRLTAPTARVLRDGTARDLPAAEVVPGDVLLLAAGDRVPADGRLTSANGVEAEESALTGESVPVAKSTAPLAQPRLPPGDRRNMVFQGTHLTRGSARALVVATGMQTEVGRIAGLIHAAGEATTPLQRRLDQLGRVLVLACLGISAAVVSGGVLRGEDPYRMFLAGVSLAVAAIPEGLPAIVSIALALGVQRMIRRNAIVRRLPAVETLGCATVVCTDKTGTLTQNRMAIRAAWASGRLYAPEDPADAPLRRALLAAALCCDASPDSGDPTEVAIVRAAAGAGLQIEGDRRAEIPFEPERRRMTVVCGDRVIVKGALDELLGRCSRVLVGGGARPLDADLAAEIRRVGDAMAARALRVLAVAERPCPPGDLPPAGLEGLERELTLLGFFGLLDPPRPEARDAVRRCHEAGVRAVMITGDHALTARAIAADLGLVEDGEAGSPGEARIVTGEDLSAWSDADLARRVEGIRVFARVSPRDKLRIVRAWRSRGHVVAMTGDGVNDAPAVKEADIGIAMGRSGTDVTKEASAMVLTDDNFATIVAAIEEGRAIYDNVRNVMRLETLMAANR